MRERERRFPILRRPVPSAESQTVLVWLDELRCGVEPNVETDPQEAFLVKTEAARKHAVANLQITAE